MLAYERGHIKLSNYLKDMGQDIYGKRICENIISNSYDNRNNNSNNNINIHINAMTVATSSSQILLSTFK